VQNKVRADTRGTQKTREIGISCAHTAQATVVAGDEQVEQPADQILPATPHGLETEIPQVCCPPDRPSREASVDSAVWAWNEGKAV